ncbi:MAG: amino acid racemase [Maricaulaceae bacterium]|jgi:aspartate racemase
MTQHIGIVAGSSEGAALCYRTICAEGAKATGGRGNPEVTLHTPPLADYMTHVDNGDWAGVGEVMLASAEKLAEVGADFFICPDNTFHQGLAFIADRSPLPWVHIADAVTDEAAARGYRKIGLTGTRWLVESAVYPEKLDARGIEYVLPAPDARDEMTRVIMDELVLGDFKPEATRFFQDVMARMKAEGCEAVILGCTEIPLIISDDNAPLPTLDSTRLLAHAALKRAMG